MENKMKRLRALSVVNAVLLVSAMAGCLYVLFANQGLYYSVTAVTELLALVFSLFYYLRGFQKDAAKYYRLFMLFYAFTYLAENAASLMNYQTIGVDLSAGTVLFSMIMYGNTLILAVGKDIGKKASYALCAFNVLVYVLPLIGGFIPGLISFESESVQVSNILLYAIWLIVALNAFVMTVAKYTDKSIRKNGGE